MRLAELDALFATFQHRAFRGELQLRRSAMKTTFSNPPTVPGTRGVMPSRWGLEIVANVACYKHGASLALDRTWRLGRRKL